MALHQRGHPTEETGLERQRIEPAEAASERLMRRHARWHGEDGPQPVDLGLGVIGDRLPGIRPTQHGADGPEHDFAHLVEPSVFPPRLRKVGEGLEDHGWAWEIRLGVATV
jgi:hypothetical protein